LRYLISLIGASTLLASPAFADPPGVGFVGTLTYESGSEPERFACDRLDLVRTLYDTRDLFQMRLKFDQLVRTRGIYGEPQCVIGRYGRVKVLQPPVLLGPITNPIGNAKLFFWAIHVDNSPKAGTADYWILYLDTTAEQVGL
jgi:hypothetical protein